jgi:hypothetical protein
MPNAGEECTNHNLINYNYIIVVGKCYIMSHGLLENCVVF